MAVKAASEVPRVGPLRARPGVRVPARGTGSSGRSRKYRGTARIIADRARRGSAGAARHGKRSVRTVAARPARRP